MRHIWSVLCHKYIIDKGNNNLSLIDITDRIGFQGELPDKRPLELPLPSALFFISAWRRGSESDRMKHEARVNVISPGGQQIGHSLIPIDLEQSPGHYTLGRMDHFLYIANGVYELQMCIKENDEWKPVASIPLEIIHTEPDEEQKSES